MPIVISKTELPANLIEFNLKDFDLVVEMAGYRSIRLKPIVLNRKLPLEAIREIN